MKTLDLSVVVPLYNEEESVGLLLQAITDALAPTGLDYETVLVDDGSRDETFARAAALVQADPRTRVIRFRRNYGQTPAMAAGIDHARGDIIVTMDGDLQNDPGDIPRLLEEMAKGFDIVVGWRHKRQDKLVTRKIPSVIANWLIGRVTGVPIKDNGCSLKAYRRSVIQSVPLYSEMHRFIPAMASITGARIAEIRVRHHARRFGESKYGLSRIYKVLLDLLTIKTIVSFLAWPLLWFSTLALPALLASALALGISLRQLFSDNAVMSIPIAGTGLLFAALAGFLLMGGVLCELIYKTGDVRMSRLSALTAVRGQAGASVGVTLADDEDHRQ